VLFSRQDPPDPTRSALRALRPSLNTPVLGVEELPPGPASAAIACLAGTGGPRISLALRSLRSGEVVFFGPEAGTVESQEPELALDAALSFAESMGFLFDDDRLAEDPDGGWRLWRGLLESAGRGPLAAPAGPLPAAPELDWLEDVAAPALAVSGGVALTKFRHALVGPPERAPGRVR